MKFLNSISKINNLTLIMIVSIYIFALGACTLLVDATPEYNIEENGGNVFGEVCNYYQKIYVTNEMPTTKKTESNYYVYNVGANKEGTVITNPKVKVILESKNGEYVYSTVDTTRVPYSSSQKVRYPYIGSGRTESTAEINNSSRIKNIGIKSIICKYEWDNNMGSGILEHQSRNYQANILTLSQEEMKDAQVIDGTFISNNRYNITFEISNRTTASKLGYAYKYKLTPVDTTIDFKVDTQVFVESQNGSIFEICGAYNYYDRKSLDLYQSDSYNYIADSIKADTIYIKVDFYTAIGVKETKVFSLDYKTLVSLYTNK